MSLLKSWRLEIFTWIIWIVFGLMCAFILCQVMWQFIAFQKKKKWGNVKRLEFQTNRTNESTFKSNDSREHDNCWRPYWRFFAFTAKECVLLHEKKNNCFTAISTSFFPFVNDEMALHFGLFAAYVILTKLLDGFVNISL